MAIKTIPLRSIEEKVDNIQEAVIVMSGQAKRVLDERIVQESIKDAEEEDYGVFDEVEVESVLRSLQTGLPGLDRQSGITIINYEVIRDPQITLKPH